MRAGAAAQGGCRAATCRRRGAPRSAGLPAGLRVHLVQKRVEVRKVVLGGELLASVLTGGAVQRELHGHQPGRGVSVPLVRRRRVPLPPRGGWLPPPGPRGAPRL